MNKVLIDKFYHQVKNGDTELKDIPKPFQDEVQQLIDGVEEEPKKDVEIPLKDVPSISDVRVAFLEEAVLNLMMEGL